MDSISFANFVDKTVFVFSQVPPKIHRSVQAIWSFVYPNSFSFTPYEVTKTIFVVVLVNKLSKRIYEIFSKKWGQEKKIRDDELQKTI